MKIHTLRHHTHEKPYQCNKCSKGFVTRNELRAHSDTHNVEKKYNCTTCNRLFRAKGNLYQHQRRHRNKRRVFICDHCDFEFTYKANLAKHISRMHTSNSGFCKTCSMNVSQFEEHMKKHRGDRPFDCESCPKTFLDKRGLHYHINLKHTKTDHYKCEKDSCSLAFPSMRMLNYHILKVHGNGTPYKCGICPRGFYRKSDYHRHKSGTHKQYLQDETVV
ncbi:unnamed protein product [Leptosia nina]|uniref:C2H2-type domain-containing protein n=1 Tax=Leptosia nina TaxID=320188 RepID=A0AAV1J042_9NEOP